MIFTVGCTPLAAGLPLHSWTHLLCMCMDLFWSQVPQHLQEAKTKNPYMWKICLCGQRYNWTGGLKSCSNALIFFFSLSNYKMCKRTFFWATLLYGQFFCFNWPTWSTCKCTITSPKITWWNLTKDISNDILISWIVFGINCIANSLKESPEFCCWPNWSLVKDHDLDINEQI